MVSKRLIREEGHQRKFLCIIDGTSECSRAVLYAERRATNTGGGLTLMYVSEPGDFQHWIGVEELMKVEAKEAGEEALAKYAAYCREHGSIDPELVYKEGVTIDVIRNTIEEDQDIAALVLAAGESNDGPGPLVSALAGSKNVYSIPVIVVPCGMTDEEIDSVT